MVSGWVNRTFIELLRFQNEARLMESVQIVRPTSPKGGSMHQAHRLVGPYGVHPVEVVFIGAEEIGCRRRITFVGIAMSCP
jgi:hypothetical protein